ncbi:hypothetical protein CAPTEDRAFT_215404 [Capitella teleta]|uniref:NACHT domain-containing protein n=2 Tax=Capitella teleta TaxID=283909 RepID=R7ULE2_CAPTE|nr:hypothetical protein CAPTEDRAFT_215404 [Capitella teleta]|eukprot:ELU07359.1 hypothetical protein CAPTEDRAFT_215404 [Capitella teleta]
MKKLSQTIWLAHSIVLHIPYGVLWFTNELAYELVGSTDYKLTMFSDGRIKPRRILCWRPYHPNGWSHKTPITHSLHDDWTKLLDRKTDVVAIFNPDAASRLQKRPKLFLFQACREKHKDSTREASAPQNKSKDEQWDTGSSNVPRYNMLIVNATLQGSKAWKEASRGSLMIDGFCRIFREKANEEHTGCDNKDQELSIFHLELDPPIEHPDTVHRLSLKWYLFPSQMFCKRKRLQHELRTYYVDKLQFVYTIPWLPTERFSLKKTFVERRLRVTSGDRKGTEVIMDEILASVGEGRNKQILVEGHPAQGKSTLSQALAYAWSQPGEATEDIKSFDLVILLHAGDFRDQDSVAEAIKTHLLPIDFDITSCQLEELLRAKNVLFIVDTFDEASNENEILHQLIEGKRLKHKTLLITSRPNFLENKLKCTSNQPSQEDIQLMNTPTALYTAIHSIIIRKAGERMNLTPEKVEESLLRSLYQFACEAHRKNETVVRKKDYKNVGNFQHICQHIAQMDREERLTWMRHLRYANYSIRIKGLAIEDHFNVRQNEPVLGFLFCLMEKNSKGLTQMAILIMKETHFSSELHPISSFECDASHQLMRLIGELNDVPPELGDAIVKRCPPHINIHHRCSASCRRGNYEILHFEYLEIGESVVPFVCRMIESLKQLRKFTSYNQKE